METLKINTEKRISLFFQIIFILFAGVFTSTILLLYSYLLKGLVPASNVYREYGICFGQIAFQGTLFLVFKKEGKLIMNYLFEMMVVSFTGGLLLIPVLASVWIFFPFTMGVYYYMAYFFMIVLYMFINHKKRVKDLGAPFWLSYTWVLYRLFVLLIILI